MKKIILTSTSPHRKEIFAKVKLPLVIGTLIIGILFVSALVYIAFIKKPTPVVDETADWKTFDFPLDAFRSFSLKYPSAWKIKENYKAIMATEDKVLVSAIFYPPNAQISEYRTEEEDAEAGVAVVGGGMHFSCSHLKRLYGNIQCHYADPQEAELEKELGEKGSIQGNGLIFTRSSRPDFLRVYALMIKTIQLRRAAAR